MDFNYRQLIFAREYRGFSQTELASKIEGLSQSNLSKFEKGISTLSDDLVLKIITFLDFPQNFFKQKIYNITENAHYRKRSAINKKTRIDIEYSTRLVGYIIDQMTDSIEWPEFTLTTINIEEGYSPEYIAKYTRKELKFRPDEPVKNIFSSFEHNGIIIVEIDATEKFDGISFWTDKGNPTIIINKNFSNDRKRFTLAHELGHLIMHNFPIPEDSLRDKENEANRFGSEFLMPEEYIKKSLNNLRLSHLAELKRFWLTSMASIIRRAKDLGCIDKEKYLYFQIELSRNGKRKSEDIEVFIDEPRLFIEAYKMHKNELSYSDSELTEAFNLPNDVIKRFCNNYNKNTKLKIVI